MFCQPFLVLNSSRLHLKMSKELHFDMPVKRNFVFWNKSIIRFFFLSFLNNVIDLVHFKSFTLARTHSPSNCTLAFQTFSKNPKLQDSDLRWRGGYNAKCRVTSFGAKRTMVRPYRKSPILTKTNLAMSYKNRNWRSSDTQSYLPYHVGARSRRWVEGREFETFNYNRVAIRRKVVLILTCQLPEFNRWNFFPFFIVQVVEIDVQRNDVFTLKTGKQGNKTRNKRQLQNITLKIR